MYGPPGTGKTLLARAVANRTDACFIRVIGSELVQKYVGEGARMVRELFQMARSKKVRVVWAGRGASVRRGERGGGGGQWRRAVAGGGRGGSWAVAGGGRGDARWMRRVGRGRVRKECPHRPRAQRSSWGAVARATCSLLCVLRAAQACIVFFDEVDAIGGARYDDGAGGDNEVQRTMLEIVNQLDGFDARGNVKVGRRPRRPMWLCSFLRVRAPGLPRVRVSGCGVPVCLGTSAGRARPATGGRVRCRIRRVGSDSGGTADLRLGAVCLRAGAHGHQPARHARPRAAAPRAPGPQGGVWAAGPRVAHADLPGARVELLRCRRAISTQSRGRLLRLRRVRRSHPFGRCAAAPAATRRSTRAP